MQAADRSQERRGGGSGYRIRKKVAGTAARPRLAVFRSLQAHLRPGDRRRARADAGPGLDPGRASCAASRRRGGNVEAAKRVGSAIAERLKSAGVGDGRLRPRRVPLPRPGQGAGRRGPRGAA